MKFLCDNCKAKYQIADDKVAGKTVRMKCRKCGHLIEIRASVTDASVATGLPPEAIVSDRPPAVETPAPAAGKAATAPRAVPGPSAGAKKAPSAGATKPSAPLKPATAGAPKPAPRPAGGGLASAFNKAVKDEPKPIEDDNNVTRALDMSSPASSEEWYIGVNGVPVGPVRLSEIRAKVAQGGINEDSLCWREGFEEWLPLKTFPELLELLEGVARSRSVTPPPTSARGGSLSNPGSARSAPPPRSNVIPFGRTATAEKLEDEPRAEVLADPFAAPPVVAVPAPAPSGLDAFAIPAPAPVPAFSPSEAPPERRRAGGIPPAAWVAIVAALALGVTAGSVLFSKPPPPPTVQIVTVTAPSPAAPVPTTTGNTDPVADVKPDGSSAAPKATGGPKVAQANNTVPDKKDDPPPAPLPGVGTLPGGGPSPLPGGGPGPTPGAGGGAEPLSGGDVQRVVNNGKNSLKRACWEPALAAKSANAPSSARVSVAMVIGPDGRVRSANASGGDGYPGLAACIGGRVRSWVFPPSSGETNATPSFTFVTQ